AAKPMNLVVAERVLDVRRARPGLAERQLPLMDPLPAHVEERGPWPLGRRDKGESVAGLAWLVHGNPFRHLDVRRLEGIEWRLSPVVPGLATRERLMQEIGRRQLEEHHGRPEYVPETGDAQDREAGEDLAEMRDPDWDLSVQEPSQPRPEEVGRSSHGQVLWSA